MPISHKVIYKFGEYRLDAKRRLLWRGDDSVTLSAKVFDLLLVLVRERGRVVSKQELMSLVWPDSAVEDSNLAVSVSTLRRALGEKSGENRFIATVPGQGYQFVAEVRADETDGAVLPVEQPAVAEMLIEPTVGEILVEEEAEETAALPPVASARELPLPVAPPLRR